MEDDTETPPVDSNDTVPTEDSIPTDTRLLKTAELLTRFPGLTVPEAMRAAKFTIAESEDPSLQSIIAEFPRASGFANLLISSERPKNTAGRWLCRVQGCSKLDQASNDGFCRSHYNLLKSDGENNADDDDDDDDDDPGTQFNSHTSAGMDTEHVPQLGECWTCDVCQNKVELPKTRCGKCKHWRGGKRQGGWKLGAKSAPDQYHPEDGIDRAEDWECCGHVIKAQQTRCGKCRGWRGGKRQVRWSYAGEGLSSGPSAGDREADPVDGDGIGDGDYVDPTEDWECKNENCKNVNRGMKKRCSGCSSWRFSRKGKIARASTGSMKRELLVGEDFKENMEVMRDMEEGQAMIKQEERDYNPTLEWRKGNGTDDAGTMEVPVLPVAQVRQGMPEPEVEQASTELGEGGESIEQVNRDDDGVVEAIYSL